MPHIFPSPGRTVVNVRQRRADYQIWVGWRGTNTVHRRPDGTFSVVGRWHLTILNRDRGRAPTEQSIMMFEAWGDELLQDIGDLRLGGPPYFRPRRLDREYPRLYIVRVSSRAHDRLSSLMIRMENRLGLAHQRRENYHISVDEAEEEYEFVD